MITYFLPRDGELHILHPSIVHLFRSYRFLLSLLFYQFLDSVRLDPRDKWICSCIRSIRMNGGEEGEGGGEEKKFESMVSGSFRRVNVPHTFYTRRVDSFVRCITNTVLSPCDTIAIFQPSNNLSFVQQTIDSDGRTRISLHGNLRLVCQNRR